MPSKKPLKTLQAVVRADSVFELDEYFLKEKEYIKPTGNRKTLRECLAIIALCGLQPFQYQLGDKFFDIDRMEFFYAYTPETLQAVLPKINTRVLWVPTINELLELTYANEIKLSFYESKVRHATTTKIYIFDPLFGEVDTLVAKITAMGVTPEYAFIIGIGRALRRRMNDIGLESITLPVYAKSGKPEDHPLLAVVDQAP